MTNEDQSTRFEELLQLLSEHGFDRMAEAIEILINEAMKLERIRPEFAAEGSNANIDRTLEHGLDSARAYRVWQIRSS